MSFVATGDISVLKTEKYDLKNFEDNQQKKAIDKMLINLILFSVLALKCHI